MAWNRSGTDRRQATRFEVLGSLRGTLACVDFLRVCNIGRGGLLAETLQHLVVNAVHAIQLDSAAGPRTINARVLRVSSSGRDAGFVAAFEFLGLDAETPAEIDQVFLDEGARSV
jgi:hypothetical protein